MSVDSYSDEVTKHHIYKRVGKEIIIYIAAWERRSGKARLRSNHLRSVRLFFDHPQTRSIVVFRVRNMEDTVSPMIGAQRYGALYAAKSDVLLQVNCKDFY